MKAKKNFCRRCVSQSFSRLSVEQPFHSFYHPFGDIFKSVPLGQELSNKAICVLI